MSEPIASELLEMLVCPETHQRLRPATADQVARMVALQAEGKLFNRADEPVKDVPEAALVREDKQFAYLIVDGIPVMLIDEAVPVDQL